MKQPEALAKLSWQDPNSGETCEYVLTEGATVTIGRSSNNDIQIAEQHVSRQHAVINYRDGIFMINDLGSSNGTFVNDQQIAEPFPLFAGDVIRFFVPVMNFLAADEQDMAVAIQTGHFAQAAREDGQNSLIVTNGPQEGQTIPLLLDEVRIGRATSSATWEIMLQDPSVSRPHARMAKLEGRWHIYDLGSSNGTSVNNQPVDESGAALTDGDTIILGGSILLFRSDWAGSASTNNLTHMGPNRG